MNFCATETFKSAVCKESFQVYFVDIPAISLVSNIQPVLDILSEENEEKITVMERILKHCEKGVSVCRRIITAFKIAAVSLLP